MQFRAISKFIRISPYKLRPFADVIRGKSVDRAWAWLKATSNRRTAPLEKTLHSAFSNAKQKDQGLDMNDLFVKEIRVDGGPTFTYFKPGAMGRATVLRKRLSHIKILLEKKQKS